MDDEQKVSVQTAKSMVETLVGIRKGLSKEEFLAKMVSSNAHLREFLQTLPSGKRREAYLALRPHLEFVPLPFLLLMKRVHDARIS